MTTPANLVWPKMLALLDCLCTRLDDSGLDPVCVCQPMPGMNVALDYVLTDDCADGSDGMAWVRLTSIYLTSNFPQQLQAVTRCNTAEAAFAFEVGIVRSVPVPEDGEPPAPEVMLALSERQVSEAMLMMNAVLCCTDMDLVMGTYVPVGPEGGAIGGRWTASAVVG